MCVFWCGRFLCVVDWYDWLYGGRVFFVFGLVLGFLVWFGYWGYVGVDVELLVGVGFEVDWWEMLFGFVLKWMVVVVYVIVCVYGVGWFSR